MTASLTPNAIAHFDICGPDLAQLTPFYAALFGWSLTPRGPGYTQVTTPEGCANGALVEEPAARLTLGVLVPDLAAALATVLAHGGEIEMPATDNGWVTKAMVRDPAGNLLTLIQGRGDR